jgi:hypothetical protein
MKEVGIHRKRQAIVYGGLSTNKHRLFCFFLLLDITWGGKK